VFLGELFEASGFGPFGGRCLVGGQFMASAGSDVSRTSRTSRCSVGPWLMFAPGGLGCTST
jgi:hypothetical protein